MRLATGFGGFETLFSESEQLRIHENSGFRHFEMTFTSVLWSPEHFMNADTWKDNITEISETAKRLGMFFIQGHTPIGNALAEDDSFDIRGCDYNTYVRSTLRTLEAFHILGIQNAIIHPGWKPGVSKAEYFERNRDFVMMLIPVMEKYGLNLLIENVPGNFGKYNGNYTASTGADLREFVSYIDHPMVHVVWDTGHAQIQGLSQYDEITAIGDELFALHIHGNNTLGDHHLPPLVSLLDVDCIMSALHAIKYPGFFTFEPASLRITRAMPKHAKPVENDPLWLQARDLYIKDASLLYDIGKYILSSYGCYESDE